METKTPTTRQALTAIVGILLLLLIAYQSYLAVQRRRRPERVEITRQLFEGIHYQRLVREHPRPLIIHLAKIDLTYPGIHFLVTPGDLTGGMEISARTTSQFLSESGAQLAINGSFFEPFRVGTVPWGYYPKHGDPVDVDGLAISQGVRYSATKAQDPNLCISPESVSISQSDCPPQTRHALAGNARLVWHREPEAFTNGKVHPRTAVALDARGETLWLIVIDGRQDDYSEGVTLAELAGLAAELGADRAMNLDGGGSSTMVTQEGIGVRVLNAPIHQGVSMFERPVANHLVVYAVASGT
ncbi:MAG: phosphodiester glycosidase family protein [Chloroflexi bacterium]|nr:phosphodiester glycosidase family protein [Chloroflexota bacterium]